MHSPSSNTYSILTLFLSIFFCRHFVYADPNRILHSVCFSVIEWNTVYAWIFHWNTIYQLIFTVDTFRTIQVIRLGCVQYHAKVIECILKAEKESTQLIEWNQNLCEFLNLKKFDVFSVETWFIYFSSINFSWIKWKIVPKRCVLFE